MSKDWFTEGFRRISGEVAEHFRDLKDQGRHELLGGWFGRNFEPHPTRQQSHDTTDHAADRNETGRDIHGNEHGIDR